MNLITIDWHDRARFWLWCTGHGCTPEYQGSTSRNSLGSHDTWSVPDEKTYVLALLVWQQ